MSAHHPPGSSGHHHFTALLPVNTHDTCQGSSNGSGQTLANADSPTKDPRALNTEGHAHPSVATVPHLACTQPLSISQRGNAAASYRPRTPNSVNRQTRETKPDSEARHPDAQNTSQRSPYPGTHHSRPGPKQRHRNPSNTAHTSRSYSSPRVTQLRHDTTFALIFHHNYSPHTHIPHP